MADRTNRNRRSLLRGVAAGLTAVVAGCTGVLDRSSGGDSPEGEASGGDDTRNESGGNDDETNDAGAVLAERLASSPPYRTYQYDPGHTGAVDVAGPTGDAEIAWHFREGASGPAYEIGVPAVADGTVYVAEGSEREDGEAHTVAYALDAATGDVEWREEFVGTNAVGSTVLAGDTLIQQVSGTLVGLDPETGAERWTADGNVQSRVTAAGDVAYGIVARYRDPDALRAFDAETGETLWTVEVPGDPPIFPTAPAVVDGTAYLGGGRLAALDAETGDELWTAPVEGGVTSPPAVADGTAYVPRGNGSVEAFDAADGTSRWTADVEESDGAETYGPADVTSPAVADGRVYAGNAWRWTALDAASGEVLWGEDPGTSRPPVIAGDTAYAAGSGLRGYDAATGEKRWRRRIDAAGETGNLPVVLDGAAFLTGDGLYALVEPRDE